MKKPQIQLELTLPEGIPADHEYPILAAKLILIPPGQRSRTYFDACVTQEPDGYGITMNGERVDPESIDTLPEALMRACLAFTEVAIPNYLQQHIREYAQRGGLERAFARRGDG